MKVIPLTIGAWNVRTLMDSSGSDRPERRTALVGWELDRYKIEIAALSETRLAKERLLKEVGVGYTFLWSGRKKEERREAGVGFAIKSHPRQQALRTSGKRHATIVKDKFYDLMIWNLWFLQHPGQTSMPEWAQTTRPGKEWLDLKM